MEDDIMRLREELDRERKETNYVRLERDKARAFLDITARKLDEVKAELKNLDKESEETEIKLQEEIKVSRQKMQYLLCEYQNTTCELNTNAVASKQALQAEQTLLENKLRNDLASLLIDIHHVDTETPVMELKKIYEEKNAHMRAISEKKLQDAETKNEKMHDELRLYFENQRKTEVSQVRDNWNKFISTLMEKDKDVYEESKALLKNMETKTDILNDFKLQLEVVELCKTSAETMEKMKNKADAKHMQMEKKIQTLTKKIQKDLLLC
ncbi:dynein regulatory complex subunit 4-like isoform X2 [Boleophthalmus pectinirostris]|uniref:dynein regulatory complex subunit 4-like isoform X2 n=1 Tax=Boleophthalmus pectinirostris TaxID=150288 RepID=UPI00242C788B|nr:dynein regulatory complex subunit 4-like isoform X2 [Boleophthalmus pectinirostris]